MHELLGVALGALMGAILALTGAGGGILAVPLLVFGLGLSMVEAAPVGLLAVALAATVGATIAWSQGLVRYRAAGLIAGIGILCAPVGLALAHRIPNTPLALVFASMLIYASVRTWRKAGERPPALRPAPMPCVLDPRCGRLRWTLPCARALAMTGVMSGVLSGLLGVGGGFVVIPALTRYTNLNMRSTVATSMAVIAVVASGGVLSASLAGHLHWQVGVPFALGAAGGMLLTRPLARRLPPGRVQRLFALTGLLAAVLLVGKALTGQ